MSRGVHFQAVSFQYDGQSDPLFSRVTVQLPVGWTGVVGANGAGKTTLLKLAVGKLKPVEGRIERPKLATYCPQRTDDPPVALETFLDAHDGTARMLQGRLRAEQDWLSRWETLSHGERKRAQLGVALWQAPKLLAIDEPTNHIDSEARSLLKDALRTFRGVGLLVSHDRDLLDTLCDQCLFVDPPATQLRPGGVSKGSAQSQRERAYQLEQLSGAKRERVKLERATGEFRREASRADRQRSKRGLSPRDRDAREKINRARLSGKDKLAGRRLRQLEGRLQQSRDTSANLAKSLKKQAQLGISIPGTHLSRDVLVRIPEGRRSLGNSRTMAHPDLTICPQDRIALVGANGSGKSTLVRSIYEGLGADKNVVTYLAQEIDAQTSSEIIRYARSLSGDLLGAVMTVVSRLGSDPRRLLDSRVPSPGEVRKLVLGLGIAQASSFLILDEPTNHLDLPSIECVEMALRDYACGILVVSHDDRFLRRLTKIRWCLDVDESASSRLRVELE